MRLSLVALACLALIGCGSATSSTGTPGTPAPEPGDAPVPGVPVPDDNRGLTYRPVRDAAYMLERHDSLTLQLPGGASQLQMIDRTAYLRVTLTPDTSTGSYPRPGYTATIVLDSVWASDGGVPAVPDSIIPARGTQWTATLSPEGELSALRSDRSTMIGNQIAGSLRNLFPTLPDGGARPGMEWSDTTVFPIRTGSFDATERAFTMYRATESDHPRASRAIKLESRGTYERTGKGAQQERPMEMTANGNRRAVYYLSQEGALVSAQGRDSGRMTIAVPDLGQTVPVEQTGSYTITSLQSHQR